MVRNQMKRPFHAREKKICQDLPFQGSAYLSFAILPVKYPETSQIGWKLSYPAVCIIMVVAVCEIVVHNLSLSQTVRFKLQVHIPGPFTNKQFSPEVNKEKYHMELLMLGSTHLISLNCVAHSIKQAKLIL